MKYLTLILTFLMTIGSQVIAEDIDDGSLSNGHLNYVCDGETYIIISTETGWALLNQPDVEVSTTYDGFMLEDHETGTQKSLGKLASGADVMYVYYVDGTKRYDCSFSKTSPPTQ